MNDFDWPCDRREAHGEHIAYQQSEDRCYPYQCPGVKAHPNTTIGGRHDGKPAMYGQIDVGSLMGPVVEVHQVTDLRDLVSEFVEDATSARGPGWGVRYCEVCGYVSFGGWETVTFDDVYDHCESERKAGR